MKNACQKLSGTQAAIAPAMSRPMTRSRMTAAHSMTKHVRDRGEARAGEAAAAQNGPSADGHVHGGVAFHRPGDAALGLLAAPRQQPFAQQQPEQHREQHDHQRAADELGQGELPAHQEGQDHAELDHQVGRGDRAEPRGAEGRRADPHRARPRRRPQDADHGQRVQRQLGHLGARLEGVVPGPGGSTRWSARPERADLDRAIDLLERLAAADLTPYAASAAGTPARHYEQDHPRTRENT